MSRSVRDLLRVPADERLTISALDARATPGVTKRKKAEKELADLEPELAGLQERLFAESKGAEGTAAGRRRLVLLLQGMDTCGKDGTVKHVVSAMNPIGVRTTAFGKPTEEELSHDFLWRIRRAVPPPGHVAVFNRSHYEDVLVVRVLSLVEEDEWRGRYDTINAFEQELVDDGVTLVKVFLHISYDEQRERLLARLHDPTKHWKFNPDDIDARRRWTDYEAAYEDALQRCTSAAAPWYRVPADRKWYRNWAIAHLLHETLTEMDPQYPHGHELDVPALEKALAPPH